MATQTFSQRISLEGAEDILNKLKTIGNVGEEVFSRLKSAVEKPNPTMEKLSQVSQQAQQAVSRFGQALPQVGQALGQLSGSLSNSIGLFSAFAGGGGIVLALGALAAFVKSAGDAAVATSQHAKAMGLTLEQFSLLSRVARQAGVDQDELTAALTRFSRQAAGEAKEQFSSLSKVVEEVGRRLQGSRFENGSLSRLLSDVQNLREQLAPVAQQVKAIMDSIAQPGRPAPTLQAITIELEKLARAATPAGEAFRNLIRDLGTPLPAGSPLESLHQLVKQNEISFKALGISLLDAKGKAIDTFEAFLRLADKLNELPDGFQKTAIAAALLSRGVGPELIEALKGGREQIDGIREALAKAGVQFDDTKFKVGLEMKQAFLALEDAVNRGRSSLLLSFGPTLTAAVNASTTAIQAFGAAINTALGQIVQNAISPLASLTSNVNALKAAFDGFAGTDIGGRIIAALQGVPAAIGDLWRTVVADAQAALNQIITAAMAVPQGIGAAFASLAAIMTAPFQAAAEAIAGIMQGLIDLISRVLGAAGQAQNAASGLEGGAAGAGGGGGGGEGFAGGGWVRGPGTPTSDSILARLSRGEFVVNAAAVAALVRRHGAGIMAAINRGFVPGFAAGGFADAFSLPRFATGGSANFAMAGGGGGSVPRLALDLSLPGGGKGSAVVTDAAFASRLTRLAVHAQVSSAGRAPSWKR